ncbi:MAG: hypothetical protein Q9193_003679 [Seirophora villosa]
MVTAAHGFIARPSFVARRFFQYRPVQPPFSRWQQWKPYLPVYAVIGVSCSTYAYNLYADEQVTKKRDYTHRKFIDRNLVFSRENYNLGRWWTMITISVMHFNALHLALNMLALASFGPRSVAMFGLPSTAIMWIGSSVAGSWAYLAGIEYKARQVKSGVPPKEINILGLRLPRGQPTAPEPDWSILGSSSSILGLLAAVGCATPQSPMYIFPIPMALPMSSMILGFGLGSAIAWYQDLVPIFGHTGHLGGMAFGVLWYVLRLRRVGRVPRF